MRTLNHLFFVYHWASFLPFFLSYVLFFFFFLPKDLLPHFWSTFDVRWKFFSLKCELSQLKQRAYNNPSSESQIHIPRKKNTSTSLSHVHSSGPINCDQGWSRPIWYKCGCPESAFGREHQLSDNKSSLGVSFSLKISLGTQHITQKLSNTLGW